MVPSSIDTKSGTKSDTKSYSHTINDVLVSAKNLLRSEINLFLTELQQLQPQFAKHLMQASFFGALVAFSVLPFLAFLVIGLGLILDGRYWLSSLVVGVLCVAIGVPLSKQALKKIKEEDFNFNQTKRSLKDILQTASEGFEKVNSASHFSTHATVNSASKGNSHEFRTYN